MDVKGEFEFIKIQVSEFFIIKKKFVFPAEFEDKKKRKERFSTSI